jgi:hypothetical protein
MKRRLVLTALCMAMLCVVAVPIVVGEEPAVVAQDLKKMRLPGRVAAVLWTRRSDYYTLQIAYPNMSRIIRAEKADPSIKSQGSEVQMWLLKADGSVILPLWRSTDATANNATTKDKFKSAPTRDVIFRFPLSAGMEAVAAAVQIGDTFLVDQITPFKD